MSSDFPKRLGEKLKAIREHSKLSPDEFAPHVQAKDGVEILDYESDKGELPVSVLIRYSKLASLSLIRRKIDFPAWGITSVQRPTQLRIKIAHGETGKGVSASDRQLSDSLAALQPWLC